MPGMAHAAQPHIQACMAGTVVRPVQPLTRLIHVVWLVLPTIDNKYLSKLTAIPFNQTNALQDSITHLVHVVRLALPLQLLDRQVLSQGAAVQLLVGGHHVDALQVSRNE